MRGMGNVPMGMIPNMSPMLQEILRMKQQGMDAASAFQQLSQKYPQFGRAFPFLGGKNPQQMDQAAQNALQQSGVDPNTVAQQFRQFF